MSVLLNGALLSSCDFLRSPPQSQESPLAKVHDKYLYPSDVKGLVASGMTRQDSLQIIKEYVHNWVKDQLVLHLARQNLTDQQLNFERQVRDYRHSLIRYTYEQALLQQKMDTILTPDTIKSYYQRHKKNYRLQHHVVKANYVRVPDRASKVRQVRKWIQSKEDSILQKLEGYCQKHKALCSLSSDKWQYLEELYPLIPALEEKSPEPFLKTTQNAEFAQEGQTVFLYIEDYRLKGKVAPLPLVQEQIRQTLLNRRKRQFLDQMYKNIYQEALKKGSVETYIE